MDLKFYHLLFALCFCLLYNISMAKSAEISGLYQSPIDIIITQLKSVLYPNLNNPFLHWKQKTSAVTCTNDGTVTCRITNSSCDVPIIYGGPLGKDIYKFSHIHFHWGQADNNGSEHVVNSRRFASEVHAVFYNANYNNVNAAIDQNDGLCVLGWFGLLREENSKRMNELYEQVNKITQFGASFNGQFSRIIGFLEDLATPTGDLANWITYKGSRTVAPYYESVMWIIYDKPFAISKKQLQRFRNLKRADGTPILDYTREIFPLNGRVVSKPIKGLFVPANNQLDFLLP